MNRIITTIVVMVCFQLAFLGTALAGPKIVFTGHEHDFGELEQGKNGEHLFTFKNAGDEPLKIKRIKTSCGCTASSTEKDLFEPGEEGEVKVVYKTKKRSGSFKQKVTVFTNDSDNPEATLNIRGVVKLGPAPAIEVKEPRVELGVFHKNSRASFTLLIENTGDDALEIYSIADYRGVVLFEGNLSIPAGETKTMDLSYKPQKPGTVKETMFITSNDPRKPRLPIYLKGYVQEKDVFSIIRVDDATFSFQNNMATTITVVSEKGKGEKQIIEPGQSAEFEFAPGESISDIFFRSNRH